MADLVPAADIERIVGSRRHQRAHIGRAVTAEDRVYILHSQLCLDSGADLRACRFSIALDRGIVPGSWDGYDDQPVFLHLWRDRLLPIRPVIDPWGPR